ncbi:MAG: ATP-binding protein [Desulfomonilaceae bacterium]
MAQRHSLLWRFILSHVAMLTLAFVFFGYFTLIEFRELQFETVSESLESQSRMLGDILKQKLSESDKSFISEWCEKLSSSGGPRITVLAPDGTVLGDSQSLPAKMADLSIRPELRIAMKGFTGTAVRYSFFLNRDVVYVAVPITDHGQIIGIVRTSDTTKRLSHVFEGSYLKFSIMVLLMLGAAFIGAILLANCVRRPINEIKDAAIRFAEGDLEYKLVPGGAKEIAELASALNHMVKELRERLDVMTRERNELESLLGEMVEAVIVVDNKKRIVRMNQTAEKIFQAKFVKSSGKDILEAIRNKSLNQFVIRSLSSSSPVEEELTVIGNPDKVLQAHGTQISDPQGKPAGALIVLNDISRLKNIDQIRKDFVANVSHELKTPVTSIKGFLETLKDGAINDPNASERFLNIAIKHTDRLTTIIEDLLKLSRVEQDADRGAMKLEKGSVCVAVQSVAKFLEAMALERGIKIIVECEASLEINMNRPLFEQALSNLVDNAIKYSGPDSDVLISAKRFDKEVIIEVRDKGCGIPSDQLPRIFERFFRVDKARTRDKGGAGLGLSIARHIINLHAGRIEASSGIGQGSVFTIHIPA